MSRYTDLDSDEHRLPEGFTRIGYDESTETYTFRAPDGSIYESLPGNRFGSLYPIGQRPVLSAEEALAQDEVVKKAHYESVRMLLPFALLMLVFIGLLFRFLNAGADNHIQKVALLCDEGAREVVVHKGDTCWAVAERRGLSVEALLAVGGNENINCDKLEVGQGICVPV